MRIDADTTLSPGSFEAAIRGAGGDALRGGRSGGRRADNAFVAVRRRGIMPRQPAPWASACSTAPRSRHATRRSSMALARAAIVDFDVHHGNGSQDIFWSDPSVMYCSTHEMPLYPGTGARDERGEFDTIVNAPLRSGDGGEKFREAFESVILRGCAAFAPDIVIISAGFDAHMRDPLASLNLEEPDYTWVTPKADGGGGCLRAGPDRSRRWKAATTCRVSRNPPPPTLPP